MKLRIDLIAVVAWVCIHWDASTDNYINISITNKSHSMCSLYTLGFEDVTIQQLSKIVHYFKF